MTKGPQTQFLGPSPSSCPPLLVRQVGVSREKRAPPLAPRPGRTWVVTARSADRGFKVHSGYSTPFYHGSVQPSVPSTPHR